MSQKPNREELEAQAQTFQNELNQSIEDLKETAKVRGTQILVAGAVVAGGYLLYSLLSGSDKKEKNEKSESKEGSAIGSVLTSYAIAIALSLAKDKLMEYLDKVES
ncbi:hypothetical protein EOJ36_03775 [Sandaracinomonas limnophila]|uniref:Uncharacterized protein n=1 Tax=Sandaracinomonas limnophila TaxID=1862386 RepID=A0A437PTG7_9BACT|nr:hypothetical protein [Sandaracinomonas limnophila]RVU25546.1 hypothetical protein EOJ36_03775 [Sandaracinomonas limnophila]